MDAEGEAYGTTRDKRDIVPSLFGGVERMSSLWLGFPCFCLGRHGLYCPLSILFPPLLLLLVWEATAAILQALGLRLGLGRAYLVREVEACGWRVRCWE